MLRQLIRNQGVTAAFCLAAGILPISLARAQSDDPALRIYQAATGFLSRGMDGMAITEYRRFLAENPSHARSREARYGLALALSRTKDFAGAEKELAALELGESPRGFEFAAESFVLLAQCRLALDRPREAAEPLAIIVRELPTHQLADDAAAMRIEALYRAGDHAEADRAAGEFLSKWKDSPLAPRAAYFAGLARLGARDWPGAADRFESVADAGNAGDLATLVGGARLLAAQARQRAGQLDQAERLFRAAIESGSPPEPDALLGLAQVLHQRAPDDDARSSESAQLLDRLLRDHQAGSTVPEARLLRARLHIETAEYDRARRLLDKLAADDTAPALADAAAYWRAKCELRAGKPQEAARILREAIDRFSRSDLLPEMRYDLAVALARAGDLDEAAGAASDFLEAHPDHRLAPEALHLGATVTHQQGRYDASLEFCDRLASHPVGTAAATAIAFLRAENLLLAGREGDARAAYGEILNRDQDGEFADRAAFRLGCLLAASDAGDEAAPILSRIAHGRETAEPFRPALLHLGDLAFAAGNWAEAERRYDEFLSFGASQAGADDALLKLGLARQRQDHHERAMEAFDLLVRQFKESEHRRQAMFERAQSLFALGREKEAASAFEGALAERDSSTDPSANGAASLDAYAHQHLGAIALRASDFDKAVQHLSRAAELGAGTPVEAESRLLLGRALAAAGRNEEAATVLADAARSAPADAAPEAAARSAIALSRAGRHEEALAAIEAAQRSHSRLDPALIISLAYERAWCLRALERKEEAADALTELLRTSPQGDLRWHAASDLADLLIEEDRFADAAALLEPLWSDAEPDGPNSIRRRAAYQLGVCAYRLDRFDQAVDFLREHLKPGDDEARDPAVTASAHLISAESLLKLGKQRQAVEHLKRITSEYADDAACAPALLRLGEALAALQDWAASERAYADYLERFADSELWFHARFGLGMARESQRRFDEAIACYREVTGRHQGPTAARAQFQLGECLFAQKKLDEAVSELLKVDILYAYPEWSAAALFEAGRCLEDLKQFDKARQQFEAVTQRFPDTRWAELARRRLEATRPVPPPGR